MYCTSNCISHVCTICVTLSPWCCSPWGSVHPCISWPQWHWTGRNRVQSHRWLSHPSSWSQHPKTTKPMHDYTRVQCTYMYERNIHLLRHYTCNFVQSIVRSPRRQAMPPHHMSETLIIYSLWWEAWCMYGHRWLCGSELGNTWKTWVVLCLVGLCDFTRLLT